MFFTQELLERRESGFGLLWLAATLGAKSSFRKLPKRSVLTADISQLCDLIAQPAEPLALRLSSNLMIGVARVYKVKQEIFLTDVTTCFHSLKKAVQEFQTLSSASELQMAQSSLRPDTLTLVADPGTLFAMDFGNIFGDWDDVAKGGKTGADEEESDDEFDPSARKNKQKQKGKARPPSSLIENPRQNLHTLDEHHDLLLSGSFDASFNGSGLGGVVPSSSQIDGGFDFGDDLFGLPEGLDFGGEIGDELARELGEGWGGSPVKRREESSMILDPFGLGQNDGGLGMDFEFGVDQQRGNEGDREPTLELNQENALHEGSIIVPLMPFSPVQGGSIDLQGRSADDQDVQNQPRQRKAKRVRLLLDARTELTDEELKAARANYVEGQESLRRGMVQKKYEKESGKLIEEMIWGVPQGLHAPVLIDFWTENFRLQVEARSGTLHLESEGQPPTKRRRVSAHGIHEEALDNDEMGAMGNADKFGQLGMDVDMGFMADGENFANFRDDQDGPNWEFDSRRRSSEEPGQARRASRPPSVFGSQFEIFGPGQDIISGSQRSALFPWDNAGASSSVNGGAIDFGRESSAKRSLGHADVRLRGSSISSRRESPAYAGRFLDSPADFGARNSQSGEGFEFDVPGDESALVDSQQSDANLLALERNSFNFLEYSKMQLKTFSSGTATLTFDDVVPKLTSTPHVAAAAFYHCLVLTTKDLIAVAQDEPYGTLRITVK